MTTRLPGSPRNILEAPLTTLATILVSAAIGTLAGCGDGTTGAPKPPASTKTTTPAATAKGKTRPGGRRRIHCGGSGGGDGWSR